MMFRDHAPSDRVTLVRAIAQDVGATSVTALQPAGLFIDVPRPQTTLSRFAELPVVACIDA
jgi:hypothetical protein